MNYLKILVVAVSLYIGIDVGLRVYGPTEEQARINLIEEALPKTVMIEVKAVVEVTKLVITENDMTMVTSTQTIVYSGSGVIVSPEGHVLTCYHLFNKDEILEIRVETYDGITQPSRLLEFNQSNDLALLKINPVKSSWVTTLALPYGQQVGQTTYAIGYPFGQPWSVTHGIISALHNDEFAYNCIQTDTFVNPGNSGGPLFDSQGELVGINKMIVGGSIPITFSGIGLATSINQITEFLVKHKVKFQR